MAGERSGLYLEIERLIGETKPAFVFLENVPAIRTRGLGRVVWGLSELGYDCRWTVVSAAEFGANHLRKRWFLLAHAKDDGSRWREQFEKSSKSSRHVADPNYFWKSPSAERGNVAGHGPVDGREALADTDSARFEKYGGSDSRSERFTGRDAVAGRSWWAIEPNVGRVAHGIPARVDRLRGLGNAVVPLQAREAFKRLAGIGG